MPRINLSDLANLENESTAIGNINTNNEMLEEIMDKALFRTGEEPNHMEAQLDMNSNRIINLPAATAGSLDPVRAIDLNSLIPDIGNVQTAIDDALAAQEAAETAAAQAIAAAASIDVGTLGIQDANAVDISGGIIDSTTIRNVPAPVVSTDISSKGYSDIQNPENARALVRVATNAALSSSPTYTAGTSTTLATLEATIDGSLTVDGVTVNNGDRVLVKDEATASHNDIYTKSTVGSHWKLTEATDIDRNTRGEVFYVNEGSVNAGKSFARVGNTPNFYLDTPFAIQNTDFATKGELASANNKIISNINDISRNTSAIASLNSNVSSLGALVVGEYSTATAVLAVNVPVAYNTIRTGGYYVFGDGGQAIYYRDTVSTPGAIQSADGAWWRLSGENLNVKQFGAKGNGSFDDSGPVQIGVDYAQVDGKRLNIPAGLYYFSTAVNITGSISIAGENSSANNWGVAASTVIYPNTGGVVFSVATDDSVDFRDFVIQNADVGIRLDASTFINDRSTLDNIRLTACNYGIQTISAANWSITRCNFFNNTVALYVADVAHPDAGDSSFENNLVNSCTTGIYQVSSGGLRIINNKFNGGSIHFQLQMADGTATGDLFFTGNSMEGALVSSILLRRDGTTAVYGTVVITGNEIQTAGPDSRTIWVSDPGSDYWMQGLVIVGNLICGGGGGTYDDLIAVDNTLGFMITNNSMRTRNPASHPVVIATTCGFGVVGPNIPWGSPYTPSVIPGGITVISPT